MPSYTEGLLLALLILLPFIGAGGESAGLSAERAGVDVQSAQTRLVDQVGKGEAGGGCFFPDVCPDVEGASECCCWVEGLRTV